jgi:hypothetical protein
VALIQRFAEYGRKCMPWWLLAAAWASTPTRYGDSTIVARVSLGTAADRAICRWGRSFGWRWSSWLREVNGRDLLKSAGRGPRREHGDRARAALSVTYAVVVSPSE